MSSSTNDPTQGLSLGDDGDAVAARRRAGLALRAAREAAGRELPQLAAQLKVVPAKLQALEEGDWSRLPDATFARALLRGACKALRIDPQPLLDLLPPSVAVAAVSNAAATAEAGSATRAVEDIPARPLPRGGASGGRHRGWWWLAVLILIAAGVVYFWPAGGLSPLGSGEKAQPASHPVAASASVSAPQAAPAASQPAASAPAAAASSAAAAASAPAKAASSVAGGGTLSIQASGQSWVQVSAPGGKVLFSQLVQPGPAQTVTIPAGSAPLSVVVGNAPQTTLTLNGQPVNLAPATRGNVARLTLP